MARPRSPAKAVRNEEIYARWASGHYTLPELAEMYGRTPQRIGQILAAKHPDFRTETARAMHRGRLELLSRQVQECIDNPGYKLAPNGRLAEDDEGNPLIDVGAKIEALKVQLAVYKEARVIDGSDTPAPKLIQVTHEMAEQQMLAAVEAKRQEMLELTRKATVVQGEVLPTAVIAPSR